MKLRYFFAAAALLMLLTTGCSGNGALLDTVPADAPAIVTINAGRLVNALDGKAYGGELTADQTIDRFLLHASEQGAREIKTIITSDAIDRGLMAGFVVGGSGEGVQALADAGMSVYTFKIKSLPDLLDEFGEPAGPVAVEGFDVYRLEDTNLLVKDDQGWLMGSDAEKAAKELSAALTRASNTPVSGVKPLMEWLDRHDDIARATLALSGEKNNGWACMSLNVDDAATSIVGDAKVINSDGSAYKFDKPMVDIDPAMLAYTMPTDLFIAGCGIPADVDWAAVVEQISAIYPLDYRQRAAIAVAVPYLKRLDGTLLIAAGYTLDERLDRSALISNQINFFLGAQVKKGEAAPALQELVSALSMLGLNPVKASDGSYTISVPGVAPVMFKALNGRTIAVTNRPLNQLGNDAARKLFKGCWCAMWADIPNSLAESTYGGRGFRLTIATSGTMHMTFALNGSTAPILEQFAMMVNAQQ